ncbi:helix-turn-helix transcriptional regulator [Kitasatospora sp. NPDC051853]|uniref:helix-turn-helix transcriptional regulator n=1 Tax=Kitasatospora sp. NPDC051853 TaxID=3364058 RepID=UPI00379F6155
MVCARAPVRRRTSPDASAADPPWAPSGWADWPGGDLPGSEAGLNSFGRTLRLLRHRAGLSQPELAGKVFVSQATISRFEAGTRAPGPALALLLDQAVAAAGALASLVPADDDRAAFLARRPGLVDSAAILELESGLYRLRRLEDASSSADVMPMVAARAEMALRAAKDAPYALRAPAIGVAAIGATYLGWCHFVAGRYEAAELTLDHAVSYAFESREPDRIERVMSFRGVLELVWGNPAAAASMFGAARHDTRVHPAFRAYDTAQQARALAHAGEAREADRLLLETDRLGETVDYSDVPVSGYWYTPGWLALRRGVVMLAQGRTAQARREIEQGYAAMPAEHRRAYWARQWIETVTTTHAPCDLVLPPHHRGRPAAPSARPARPRRPRT